MVAGVADEDLEAVNNLLHLRVQGERVGLLLLTLGLGIKGTAHYW